MEDEGRQRKVEAGREMFVAYKKKKSASKKSGDAKKKKKNEEHTEESLKESSDSSFSNDSFRLNFSVTPDVPRSIATGGAKEETCDKLQIRVAELEDMLAGKSAALEALSLELEALNESSRLVEGPVGMLSPVSIEQDYKTHLEEYRSRLLEFQAAVTQRDGLIEQLSSSLQSALSTRDTLQLQGEQLAQEVALLQKQLQATMELVQGHHWDTGIQPDQFLTLQNKMLSLEALVARHQCEAADLNRELEVKDGELASKTQDLARSKTKAAQEVQKLMGEVEELQQKAARASLDHEGKLAKLRAELEENFGLQLGHIKEELRNQFESEKHTLEEKHSKELSSVQLAHQVYVQQVERYIEQLNIDSPIDKIEPVIDPTLKLQLEQLGHDKLVLNRRLEDVTEESKSLKRRLEELTQNNDRLRCELGQQAERYKFGLDCVSHPFVDINKTDEKLSKELLELRPTCSKDSTNANKYSIEELELYKQNVTTLTNQLQQSLQTNERLTLELIQFKDRHKVESDAMNKSLQELSEKEKNLTETIINLKKSHGAEILSYIQQLDALNTQLASLKTEQKSSINASDVDLENMKHSYELELVSYKQVIDSLNERLIEALQAEDNFPKVLAAHVVNFQADIVKYKEKIDALNVQLQESLKTEQNHIKLLEAKEVELFVSKEQIEKLTATLQESSNMEVYLKTQIDSLNKQLKEALNYETEKQNKLLDSQIKESINDVEIQTYKEEINSLNIKLKEFLNIKEEARTHSSLIVTLKAQLQEVLNENSRYKDELNLSKCQIDTLTSECQTLPNLHECVLSMELENKALKLKLDEISQQKEELSSVNAKLIQDLEENLKKTFETEKTKTKEVEYLTHSLESKIKIEEEYKGKISALELELASFKNEVIASGASGGSLKLCQQEIVTLKERLAESQNEEKKHIKEIAACQMEAQSYKQQVELLDSRFAEELASNMVEIEELSGKLVDHAIAQNKVKLLEEALKNKEDEMDLVMQELQSYKEKVQQLKQSDVLYSQSVEKEVEIQMLQAQTSELNSCKEQIQVYQDRLKQFEDLIEVLSNSLVEKESEVKVFKEQSSHEMSFKQQVFLCEQRLQQFEGLTQQVKDVTSKLVDKEACIASLQEQCSHLQSCKERLESCEEKLKLFDEMEKNFGIITSQLAEKDDLVKELQKSTLDGKKLNDLLEDMNQQVEILTSQLVEKDIFIAKLEEKFSNAKLNKELVLESTSTNVETATPHSSGLVNNTQPEKGDFIYVESSKEQNDNLNKQLKEAIASKDLYSKEVEALTSFLDENASEKEALQKEISILHQELESKKVYEKKNEDLNKQLLEQINILNGNLSSNADTKTRLEQEVKEFQKKLNSIIGEKIELNNMLTERIKTEEYLTAEAISQQANAIAYKEQFEYLKVELQEQLSEVGLAHAEDLSTLRREVQQLTELNIELSGSEEELQSKVQYLTNMNRNLRMEVSGLKELSESLRSQLQDFTAQNLNYESLLEGQREVETDFQVALKEQRDKSLAELQEMTVQYLKAEGLLSAKEELQVSMAEHISQLEANLANVNQSFDITNKQYLLKIAKAKELLKRLKIEKEEVSNKVLVLEKLCESLNNENHNLTAKNRELSELLKEKKDIDNVTDCVTDKNTSTREKRSTTIEPYVASTIQIKNLEQEKEELVCQLNKAFEDISFLNIQHHELSQAHSECTQLRSENIQLQSKLSEKELLEHELIGGLATAKAQYDQLNQTVLLLEAGFKEVEEENGKTFQAQEALKLQLTEEKDKVLKLSQLKAELESQLSSFEKECKAATELRVVLEHQLLDCLTKEDGVELLILSNSTYAKEGIVLREKVLALKDELKVVEMKNAKITRELEIAWQVQKDGEETFAVLKKDLGLLELENKQLLKQVARKSAAVSPSEGQDILVSLTSEKSILTTINMAADKKDTREIDILADKEILDETNYTKGYKKQKLDEKNIDLDVQGSGHGLEKDELTFLNTAAGGSGLDMESDEAILEIGAKQESRKVINIGTDKTSEISRKLEAVLKRNTDLMAEKESLLEKLQMQQSPVENLQHGGEDAGEAVKLSQLSDHQNELIAELSAYREQHAGLTEVLGSTGLLQETLWQQKQELIRKLKEKEALEHVLEKERAVFQTTQIRLNSLEHQLMKKDDIQKELSRQKALLELNLREIEDKLMNQEKQLLLQKLSLEAEIRSRDLHVRHWQLQAEVNKVHQSPCVLSVSDQERLDELRSQLEQTHEEAVTRLKRHLKSHFTLREAELQKQFSGQLSAVRRQHADQLEALSTHIQSKLHQLDVDAISMVDGSSYTSGDLVTNQLRKQEVTDIIHKLQTELKAVLEQHLVLLEQRHLQDSSTDNVKHNKTDHLKNMADEVEEEVGMEANSSINVLNKVKHLLLREYTSALKVLVGGWHTGLKERLQGVSDDLREAWCQEESALKTRDMAEIARSHNALAELLHIRGKMVSQLKALEHEAVEFHRNSVMRLHSELQGEHEQVVDRVEQMKNSVAEGATIATLQAQLDRMTQEARRFPSDTAGMAELRKELEIKHAKEMEELRRYFEQKCADVEKRYSEEVFSQHSRKLSDSSASSAEELVSDMYYGAGDHGQQKLPPLTHICETFTGEPNYKELEERYRVDFDKRLLEYHSKLEEAKVDLEEKYQGEMMTLKKHYEDKVEQLVNDLAQSHHTELSSLQEKHNKEISNRVDQIQGEHNQELQSLRESLHEECALKLTELCDKHAKETQELKISYQQDLDDKVHELQRRNAADLEAVKARCEKGLCESHDLINSKDKLRGDTLNAHQQEELKILEDFQAEKRTEELCGTNSEAAIVGIDIEEKVHKEKIQVLEAVRARICQDKSTETYQRAVPQPGQGQDFATVLRMLEQWCSDDNIAGFVDQLQVLHNKEIKTLEDSFVERRLMSDSSVNTPLELTLLEQRFTSPLHTEITTLKQELATLKVQQSQGLKLNHDSDIEDAFKERDVLRRLVATLQCLLQELVNYFGQCEEELNSSLVEGLNTTDKVHFAPDVSELMSFLHDSSVGDTSRDISVNFRGELDRCLERLRMESATILGLSRKLREAEGRKEVVNEGFGESIQPIAQGCRLKEQGMRVTLNDPSSPHLKIIEELCQEGDRISEEARKEKEDLQQQVWVDPPPSTCDASKRKVEVADKQLRSTRKFLEEQAAEREVEREEFLRELTILQDQVRERDRERELYLAQIKEASSQLTVEALDQQLKESAAILVETEARRDQIQADLDAALDKISTLREIIVELEATVEDKAVSEEALKQQLVTLRDLLQQQSDSHRELAQELSSLRLDSGSLELQQHITHLEEQLRKHRLHVEHFHSESKGGASAVRQMRDQLRELEVALERKTKELEALHCTAVSGSSAVSSPSEDVSIREHLDALRCTTPISDICHRDSHSPVSLPLEELARLQDKLQRHSRAEEAALKRVRDLHMELKIAHRNMKEVCAERDVLQEQTEEQLLKISALQARLDDQRRAVGAAQSEALVELQGSLRDKQEEIGILTDALERTSKQVSELQRLLEQMRHQEAIQEAEWVEALSKLRATAANNKNTLASVSQEEPKLQTGNLLGRYIPVDSLIDTLLDSARKERDRLQAELDWYHQLPLTPEQEAQLNDYLQSNQPTEPEDEVDEMRYESPHTSLHFTHPSISDSAVHKYPDSRIKNEPEFAHTTYSLTSPEHTSQPSAEQGTVVISDKEGDTKEAELGSRSSLKSQRSSRDVSPSLCYQLDQVDHHFLETAGQEDLKAMLIRKEAEIVSLSCDFEERLQKTVSGLRQEAEEKDRQLMELQDGVDARKAVMAGLEAEVRTLKDELGASIEDVQQEREVLTKECARRATLEDELRTALSQLTKENARLKEEHDRLEAEREQWLKDLMQTQGEHISKLQEENDKLREVNVQIQEVNAQLEEELAQHRSSFQEVEESSSHLEEDPPAIRFQSQDSNIEMETRLSSLEQMLSQSKEESEHLRHSLDQLTSDKELVNKLLKEKQEQIDFLHEHVGTREKVIHRLSEDKRLTVGELEDSALDFARTISRLQELEEENKLLKEAYNKLLEQGSLDELSGQVQKELEESAKLELSLLEKLGAAEEREDAHPDSALSLPATPVEKILHKILHSGIDMLTFAELSLLHQTVCSATSQMILQDGTPRLGFEVPEMPVTIPGLAPDDKRVLLQRVAALEVEVMKRHQEKQKKVYELESNLRKEKKRLHEMREVLNNEQRHNLELQNRIGLQSQSMADLEVQREILQRRSSYHESRVHEYIGQLEAERSKVRSLEDDLSKERSHVKHLEALLESERKRVMEAKLKDSSYIESMRQQLDTALDSETKLRRKLVDQVPHRDRNRGSCRCNYALTETTTAKLTEIKEELCHERVRVVELEAALANGREMLLDLEIREEKSRKQVDTEREVSVRLQTEVAVLQGQRESLQTQVSEYKAELGALRAELDMKAYSLQELEVLREHRNKNRQQLESLHRRKLSLEQKLSALQQQQLTTQSSSRNVTPVDDIKQDQVEGFVSPIYSSQQMTTLSPALHANEECLMTQLADAQRQLSILKDRLAAHDEEISLLTQELAVSRQREAELERRVTPEGQEPETSPLLKIGKVSSFGSDQSLKEEKGISEVVSRLNKEKEELLNALKVVQDREQSNAKSWADEKAALIRAVLAAEADVDNIHSQEIRDGELTVTDMDERVAHLFGKYLRSESYRKALVWQKRYLLVVLGGYQECEALTLDRLAFLSGCSQDNGRTRSPKDKFRSAVLVVVVIQRMKYLVRRWKHGRRLGGNAVLNRLHTESVASSTRSSYNAPRRRWGSYSQSPPCKDVTFRGAHWHSTSTSQPWRLSETVGFRPSQLSEYIDRFDQIQQRLGLAVANRPT